MIDFRYISIITIFCASLIGSVLPYFINSYFTPFIKMFSAGIILSLSLVHIVPDSINDLNIFAYTLSTDSIPLASRLQSRKLTSSDKHFSRRKMSDLLKALKYSIASSDSISSYQYRARVD